MFLFLLVNSNEMLSEHYSFVFKCFQWHGYPLKLTVTNALLSQIDKEFDLNKLFLALPAV